LSAALELLLHLRLAAGGGDDGVLGVVRHAGEQLVNVVCGMTKPVMRTGSRYSPITLKVALFPLDATAVNELPGFSCVLERELLLDARLSPPSLPRMASLPPAASRNARAGRTKPIDADRLASSFLRPGLVHVDAGCVVEVKTPRAASIDCARGTACCSAR